MPTREIRNGTNCGVAVVTTRKIMRFLGDSEPAGRQILKDFERVRCPREDYFQVGESSVFVHESHGGEWKGGSIIFQRYGEYVKETGEMISEKTCISECSEGKRWQ